MENKDYQKWEDRLRKRFKDRCGEHLEYDRQALQELFRKGESADTIIEWMLSEDR